MNNLYVKLNLHCSYTKQVIVLKVADRRTDVPGDDNRHPPTFWLRTNKTIPLILKIHAKQYLSSTPPPDPLCLEKSWIRMKLNASGRSLAEA